MSDKEKVPQFWDKGIQLVDGCTKVSPGCNNCWSEGMTARFKRVPDVLTGDKFNGKVQFNLHLLEKAAKVKKPTVYAIWNDLYHEGVTDRDIENAYETIREGQSWHTFLIVTKRPERFNSYWEWRKRFYPNHHLTFPDNIWHIVTCENQAMADKRIPHLLKIPGKRGIIIEPMLEDILLERIRVKCGTNNYDMNVLKGTSWHVNAAPQGAFREHGPLIHQVICGPENGPGKRPFDPAWADNVKEQCEAAGVPFYRKDTGEGELAWRTP